MRIPSLLTAGQSIRTQFGLVTASILLTLLFVFYLGGRFILVHMIRDAEKEIQVIGSDIKSIVYGELSKLQQATFEASQTFSRSETVPPIGDLQKLIKSEGGITAIPIHLAAILRPDGSFRDGCYALGRNDPVQMLTPEMLVPYIGPFSPLLNTIGPGKSASGLIAFKGKPLFVAITPIVPKNDTVISFLIIGSLFHNTAMLDQINEATHGMQVSLDERQARSGTNTVAAASKSGNVAPIFSDMLSFYSGGKWHVGENAFQAILPIHDVFGKEVSSISISLPRSFSSLATIALGWLTAFVAVVGIIFVVPIFWLQTRIVLNPLTTLANQIREIGEHHLDGNCNYLQWPHKDEFGLVAQSVNGMLDSLSRKTQHIFQVEQRQRALIEGMPDCLCVFDANGSLIAIHKQPDYVHPIPGLIVGKTLAPPLFPQSDCDALRIAIAEAFRSEKVQMMLISCRESDGSYRHFETRISLMDAHFALVILRDVTHEWREREVRQQMESRLIKIQKMESLGNLSASIAHDFNNILMIIQNTVDVALPLPRTNKAEEEAIVTVKQAAAKGTALTHELMTYAGQTQSNFKRDDPNNIILEMQKLMGGVISSNIALELKLTPGLAKVDVDPLQFWKVLINLLKNASEAINGTRGKISISTYAFEVTESNKNDFFSPQELIPGPGVMFQIDDTGSGIPKELIERLFDPFFSTKAMGRGLGLSTVLGIVGTHNGGIAIDSEPSKGSTFRVWLPAAKTNDPALAAVGLAALPTAPASTPAGDSAPRPQPALVAAKTERLPCCVLMVEDDPAILTTTRILLRSLGADVFTALSKREALALFRKHVDDIGLILMDAQIGSLDTVRLLSTLRMRKSGIPTVIVSGHTETRIREMFASEPFNGFLSKPYTRDDLWRALAPFISLRSPDSI